MFEGDSGPFLFVPLTNGSTGFRADFEATPTRTAITIDFVKGPTVLYQLTIRAGDYPEPVVDWAVADDPAPRFLFEDVAPPYDVTIRPWNADVGLAWVSNVTQFYDVRTQNDTNLSDVLEARALSDNETQFENLSTGVGVGTAAALGVAEWNPTFSASANVTIIEVATSSDLLGGAKIQILHADEVMFEKFANSDDASLYARLELPGPYGLRIIPEPVQPPAEWRVAMTQFYAEVPGASWRTLL